MSNQIVWERPPLDSPFTHVRIERANLEAGPYTEVAVQVITDTNYYDATGTSSHWYRIRFYDGVNGLYSEYATPTQGSAILRDVFDRTVTAVTVLGTLGACGPNDAGNYDVYGMEINQQVAEMSVRQAYNYAESLVGVNAMTDAAYATRVEGFVSDYAALRILAILCGISIPTHFNFTSAGLNIQKPVSGQMKQAIEMYMYSCKRWQKTLLKRGYVSKPTDLQVLFPNERPPRGSGILEVTYDGQSV